MLQVSAGQPVTEDQVQMKLRSLTDEIVSDLSRIDAARSKELLSDFVSELFLSVAEQRRREERRQRQAEGIAAAKAKGVHFGRTAKPLPGNFDEVCRAWRNGQMSLKQAAEACNMASTTFYDRAMRLEKEEQPTG